MEVNILIRTSNMFELLQFPFVQRALLGGVIVSIVLGWIGVYATSRNMSFIGAGVAHASLAAIAFALLFSLQPIVVTVIFAIFLGLLLYYLDTKTDVSRDTAIGILFSAGMALGVLLLQFKEGFTPELSSFLFGNILSITTIDLWVLSIIGVLLLSVLAYFRKQLLFLTIDSQGAYLHQVPRSALDAFLYIATAVSVVLSIKLVGIVLVTALLVIPAASVKGYVRSFAQYIWSAIGASFCIVFLGMLFSLSADLPSGATIVLFGAALFILSRIILAFSKK